MLTERIRRALAPDYEILGEIAGGGMGVVFAARQRRLDRTVAIKFLRPEHATAVAVERFLAEGRLLARLAHPNVVPIYDAGEADGLLYYVMEYIQGETLAHRLAQGPLPPEQTRRLADDLLAALTAAHGLGVVHRDVKPANVFLREGRALLADFGIARWREEQGHEFTTPGQLIGTPRYMAPEQREGLPATPRTDVYAVGLVIWEAATGRPWPHYQDPSAADWSTLPPGLVEAIHCALNLDPEQRWANAQDFAAALARQPRLRRRHWSAALGAGVVVLLAAGAVLLSRQSSREPLVGRGLALSLAPVVLDGAPVSPARALGDSLSTYLRNSLSSPDFYVIAPGAELPPGTVEFTGTATLSAGQLRLVVQERGLPPGEGEPIRARAEGTLASWLDVADSVAAQLFFQLWKRAAKDPFFPGDAIPESSTERAQLARAEQFFSLGRWEEAQRTYQSIETRCLLCAFRSLDIDRWFGQPHEPERLRRLQRAEASFPDQYRSLIHAAGTPGRDRLDTLSHAVSQWPGFFLAAFEYGDEILHRGPLYGRLRAEALAPLRSALAGQPRFEPGLEHLTWLLIGEGDSAAAAQQLGALLARPTVSGLSGALSMLRRLGYQWRFMPVDSARSFSARLLRDTAVQRNTEAVAGARLMMSMDTPRGAVELGELFARWREVPDAALPGLLARLYGFAALGMLDSVRATGKRFGRLSGADPSYGLLALELEAVLRSFDPDTLAPIPASLREELSLEQRRVAADPRLRRRTAWVLGLLAARRGDTATLATARARLAQERDAGAESLGRVLEAAEIGPRNPRRALELVAATPSLDQEPDYPDPLQDAVVHLLRAEWQERLDQPAEASHTLRWHEHAQLSGHLLGAPQAGELAWAVGTLARWQRARLLGATGDLGAEWCSVNRGVARLWSEGDSLYRARAALARHALANPACTKTP